MSTTLKALGVEVLSFTKSRQEEAVHTQSSLRITPFLRIDSETFDWSTIIAKPELISIKGKKHESYVNAETMEEDLLQGEAQWPYAENSLYLFSSLSPFRLSLLQTLSSQKLVNFMRLITIINVAAVCAYDYQSRIESEDYERNRICTTLEIVCNTLFGLECLGQIIVQGFVFGKNTYLKSWWNIANFATFISTWAILGHINSSNQLVHILRVIRIFRALRLIQDSKTLKKQLDAFIGSFQRLGPILVPLLFVVLYYSIIGLHLFMGVTEYRCRETPEPEDGKWIAVEDIKHLCGIWDCPEDTYCGSLADHGLPRDLQENRYEQFGFGFIRFDDFFYSLFVVFTFLTIIGWSGTTFMFWRAMTTYVTAFYFVSLIFILAYLLSNLLLASFYESFMVLSSIKQNKNSDNEQEALENEIKKKKQQQMMTRLQQLNDQKNNQKRVKKRKYEVSLYYEEEEQENDILGEKFKKFQHFSNLIVKSNLFNYLSCSMILISTIVIISDHHSISDEIYENLLIVDFICIIYFIVELIITIWGIGMEQFKEIIDIFDTLVILSQFILIVVLFFLDENVIINYNNYVNFVKALKMLRLMKFLYIARIFYSISVLARCLVQTLLKIKDLIFLFVFLIIITSLFGQELLAYKVRFEELPNGELEISHSNEGISAPINYEGFGNALMAATNVFYNEEWHITMFIHAQKIWVSILYHIISILMGQVLFVRLFLAVFLNEFCQQLKKIEQEIKPINFLLHGKKVLNFLVQFIKKRRRSKIHSQAQLQQQINPQPRSSANPARVSMFHNLNGIKLQRLPESTHNELLDQKVQTPSNIFCTLIGLQLANKESMIDPLKKEDKPTEKNTDKQNHPEEDHIQDHNIDDHQHEEDVDHDSSQEDHLKSPDEPSHPVQGKNINKRTQQKSIRKTNSERTLFIFAPESDFRQLVTTLVTNIYFRIFNFTLILLTCIRIALLSPLEDPNSDLSYVLQIGYIFLTVFYILVILLNCIAFGLYKTEKSFFRQSVYNIFSFAITIVDLITLIFDIQHPLSKFITSLRILQFIQIGAVFSQNIAYAQASLLNAFTQMIQLAIFCIIILSIYGIFALKILKGTMYYCDAYDAENKEHIKTSTDCYDYGGSWINQILTFDTIFSSILTLFCVATSENWIPLQIQAWNAVGINRQPISSNNRTFSVYFQIFFFLGFLCLLNMFIGLIVNAYQEAKMKAQNLHLLDETQREWFQIKMQIYTMKPLVKSQKPENALRKLLFFMVKQKYFKIFWLVIIFRADENYKNALDVINDIFVSIFAFEILCRFFAKEKHLYFKDISNIVDIIAIWWAIANLFIKNKDDYNFYFKRISNAISVAYQLQRNYRIVKRFNNLEKLFSSIFSVIPNALSMLFIMFIFLFIYTTLGIDMFAFIRTQTSLNGWDQHFRKFSTAMFALIKVASSESWWTIMIDTLHEQSPNYACNYMSTYEDFLVYGFNGCGTPYAYLYFISFHIIFSLMILNLLIASVLVAYEEHVKSEESAVSKYQLNDVLSLWRNYDPEGKGFINYKDFWKLSSEIAIIFGVAQDDLLDVNNKKNFLKVLNIPIYESKESNMLCYKFHDVILSLTKISVTLKYGVTNLEPTDKIIQQKLLAQLGDLQRKDLMNQFTPTSFNSGDMVAIIYIQKKFRLWKKRVQVLREGGDVKAIYNEMSDLKNMIKKQLELEEQQEKQN
ncbi:unnamed protein product (macronuclear) [Paramecium tetraurelia]|uniref:Ion transport domain-containing protein n=1 Tax=Paramecium tetraurelia TaxID=5888 RepID=A0E2X2_PARTE|nr:uncharacterized protein GSPATT00022811001 [Paramecium tetraurelia]CAK89639.1 unnamed protein product [Paramecium tetraurelia]|eukprot:XP_001457036.1 hypothetical protein (macronuclear) [Paramecium tetraurelia strain d4-2]